MRIKKGPGSCGGIDKCIMKEHTYWDTANLGEEKGKQQKGLLLHFTDVLIAILIVHSHGFSVTEFTYLCIHYMNE